MAGEQNARARGQRKTIEGFVVSAKMDKTITVRSERLVKHAKYGKYIRRSTISKAHDERNEAQQGDLVEIVFGRPLSKTKNWRLVRVVKRSELGGETVATAESETNREESSS